MARLSLARRLLANTMLRIQYQVLDPGVRHVWDVLLGLMEETEDRALRPGFGLGTQAGLTEWVSIWVSISITQAQTGLDNLRAAGLLIERDGALMPPSTATTRRAEQARINGSKGGRPRKSRSVPGQQHMMMPISGGLDTAVTTPSATPSETQIETQSGSWVSPQLASLEAKAIAKLASLPAAEAGFDQAAAPAPAFVVAQHALAVAKLDPAQNRNAIPIVTAWLGLGITPERIMVALADKCRLMHLRGKQAKNLSYFDRYMAEQAGIAPTQAVAPVSMAQPGPATSRLPPSVRNRGLDPAEELMLLGMLAMHDAGERERLVTRASMNRTKAPRTYRLLVELHPEVAEWVEGERRAVA